MNSTPKPIEEKVSEILLTADSSTAFTLHQALTITKLFSLTGSMEPLTAKSIHVIIQSKKMKCITYKQNEVYNVIHNDRTGEVLTR